MAIERKNLKPMQAYYDESAEQYFWTPDGEGGVWYDTEAEMREDVGYEGKVTTVSEILDY